MVDGAQAAIGAVVGMVDLLAPGELVLRVS